MNVCRNRRRSGALLVLAAVVLALATYVLAMSLTTSQKFLVWKTQRSRAEAAAVAAVLALDGTEAGIARARAAAAATVGLTPKEIQLDILPTADAVQFHAAGSPGIGAGARQHELADVDLEAPVTLAAPNAEAPDFGLTRGGRYAASGEAKIGHIVAVRVLSGLPKQLPLTWIAGRVVTSKDGRSEVENLGGYLRGATHGAVQPHGYFEATLGGVENKEEQ